MSDRKGTNTLALGLSGNIEELGSVDQLLDDFLPEKNKFEEVKRKKRKAFDACDENPVSPEKTNQGKAATIRLSVGNRIHGSMSEILKKLRNTRNIGE